MFLYSIPSTPWYVVVGLVHYYHNVDTGESCWQLSETGVDPRLLDYNFLGVLFAKARGLRVETQSDESGAETANGLGVESGTDAEIGPEQLNLDEMIQSVVDEVDEKENNNLGLGYSSEDSDDESGVESAASASDQSSLDLELEEVPAASHDDFIRFLDLKKDRISVYNPWFLVEEELITELAQTPAYFQLDPKQREELYNQWAKDAQAEVKKYPTPKQQLLNFLCQNKGLVKEHYFVDAKPRLPALDLTSKQMQEVFVKYKSLLKAQTNYEREFKKNNPGNKENLKKKKLLGFLGSHNYQPHPYQAKGDTDYQKWVNLCNDLNLPELLVEDEVNFIVADTKRLECYLGI